MFADESLAAAWGRGASVSGRRADLMFFLVFDLLVFVRPKNRPSRPRRRRFTFNEASDGRTGSSHLCSDAPFSFAAAVQTRLRGIFKEERGKTLFHHQPIKVPASEETAAAGDCLHLTLSTPSFIYGRRGYMAPAGGRAEHGSRHDLELTGIETMRTIRRRGRERSLIFPKRITRT